MASLILFSALCILLLCHGCMAQSPWQTSRHGAQSSQQCRFDRLSALEPNRRIESSGGVTEYFDESNQQLECAGVAAIRHTLQPKGLLLPFYSNAPGLIYILQGEGIRGAVIPGCPETYQQFPEQQESKQQPKEQQREQQQQSQQKQHQRIWRINQGYIVVLPSGLAHWMYNDGDSPIVAVTVFDTSNSANQLDNNLRRFSLAGESKRSANNIFRGFSVELLSNALGVNPELAQKLQQGQKDEIVKVEGDLEMVTPWREEQQSQEERGESGNGVDQALCTIKFRENIDNPSRADMYNPQAGRYTHLNGQKLTILNYIQMSATRGVLQRDAILAPHWNINAHSILYVSRGRGRVQIVGDNGKSVFDDDLRQGRLVIVPQNYVVVMQARDERFEWVEFKTHGNAIVNQIVGQGSYFRGLPDDVVAHSYQGVSRGEARVLKNSVSLVAPRSHTQQGMADASHIIEMLQF